MRKITIFLKHKVLTITENSGIINFAQCQIKPKDIIEGILQNKEKQGDLICFST